MVLTATAKLIIGRGEIYFDRFAPGMKTGDGELYMGNTPGCSFQRAIEDLERVSSYGGRRVLRESVITRETYTGNLTTDNMDEANLGLLFGGEADPTGQLAAGYITETFKVKRGRFYQLGQSKEGFGARWIEPDYQFERVASPTNLPVAVAGNLIVDRTEGRFQVRADAIDVADGDTLQVTFQYRQSMSSTVSNLGQDVYGSLRFLATSPNAQSYFFPYVRLTPSGSMDLKSDNWQQAVLAVEIMKLSPSKEFFYLLAPAPAQYTEDELAIINLSGVTLEEFPYWDDQLNTIINIIMPADDLGHALVYP